MEDWFGVDDLEALDYAPLANAIGANEKHEWWRRTGPRIARPFECFELPGFPRVVTYEPGGVAGSRGHGIRPDAEVMVGGMASKIAVMHIGTHKTGTTSLQSMIARNDTYFADQGLFYPTVGRAGDGHHNLAWELNGDERYDPSFGSFDDLIDELRQAKPRAVLISSEDFEYLHLRPESLRNFRRRLSRLGYKTHVIVVLRQPRLSRIPVFRVAKVRTGGGV